MNWKEVCVLCTIGASILRIDYGGGRRRSAQVDRTGRSLVISSLRLGAKQGLGKRGGEKSNAKRPTSGFLGLYIGIGWVLKSKSRHQGLNKEK
jgi:hypothetical protein